jgi:flagellar biogenesis protein FliO
MRRSTPVNRTHQRLSMAAMIVSMVASLGMLGISAWNVRQVAKAQRPAEPPKLP